MKNFEDVEKRIYTLQKRYEKKYKTKVNEDLHIQKLYLRQLLKELKNNFTNEELDLIGLELKIFNKGHCYYLTDGFFRFITQY